MANFENYDDESVYLQSLTRAVDPATRNFVIDFGKDYARIAFDSSAEDAKKLLDTPRDGERQIRWMYACR